MIEISLGDGLLRVGVGEPGLRPRHESQLNYWGFAESEDARVFTLDESSSGRILPRLIEYFGKEHIEYEVSRPLQQILDAVQQARQMMYAATERCKKLKGGKINTEEARDFLEFLDQRIPRKLKQHQIKAALHLLAARNGANFSVPGSGKTTVVLTVFQRLRELDEVDALFVVGPPACFGPWRREYRDTLGVEPSCEILAGGEIESRRSRYLVDRKSVRDLYLTSFQTLQNDWPHVRTLFQRQGIRFFFVVDEAHYVKQIGGIWATAVLNVAREAVRKCVLTGTPFPRSLTDAFNLFDILWPDDSPLTSDDRHRVELHNQRNESERAADILNATVGPLFYRVRKSELDLAPQVFHEPVRIRMKQNERLIYDSILDRVAAKSREDFFKNFDTLIKLRKGRMMRLRQCISYPALLSSAVAEYRENLYEGDLPLAELIGQYETLEVPAKLDVLTDQVSALKAQGKKVVVWSSFVGSLKRIVTHLEKAGSTSGLIYGGTPFETTPVADELSREQIIQRFCNTDDPMNVLVANPAACAESISLHKACSHAIYYDLSYNCAQFLQSLDRIHRVGGSETIPANYYFLQYEDTIDNDILLNLRNKESRMNRVIDEDYPIYTLDMFDEDEELEAYERLFGGQ